MLNIKKIVIGTTCVFSILSVHGNVKASSENMDIQGFEIDKMHLGNWKPVFLTALVGGANTYVF